MKDYKKILEGVVNIINTTENSDIGFVNICSYIGENCPELKESEDERIRKGIIRNLEYLADRAEGFVKDELKERIAWLEKQESVGEIVERCKTSWYNEGKIQGQIEGLSDEEKYQQGWHDALEKQAEQKPTDEEIKTLLRTEYEKGKADAIAEIQNHAWSEEDESYLNTTIAYLKDAKEFKKSAENCINWLKSLKDRVQPILRRRHTIFDEII